MSRGVAVDVYEVVKVCLTDVFTHQQIDALTHFTNSLIDLYLGPVQLVRCFLAPLDTVLCPRHTGEFAHLVICSSV